MPAQIALIGLARAASSLPQEIFETVAIEVGLAHYGPSCFAPYKSRILAGGQLTCPFEPPQLICHAEKRGPTPHQFHVSLSPSERARQVQGPRAS